VKYPQTEATEIPYAAGFGIGCLQILALFPGVSRLGITMTGGRLFGYSLQSSTNFAFLLAMPAIAGAIVLKAERLVYLACTYRPMGMLFFLFFMLGLTCLFSIPAIWVFKNYVTRMFIPVILYRIAFGILFLLLSLS
jgi:undecaprenyl-diphosphatase